MKYYDKESYLLNTTENKKIGEDVTDMGMYEDSDSELIINKEKKGKNVTKVNEKISIKKLLVD